MPVNTVRSGQARPRRGALYTLKSQQLSASSFFLRSRGVRCGTVRVAPVWAPSAGDSVSPGICVMAGGERARGWHSPAPQVPGAGPPGRAAKCPPCTEGERHIRVWPQGRARPPAHSLAPRPRLRGEAQPGRGGPGSLGYLVSHPRGPVIFWRRLDPTSGLYPHVRGEEASSRLTPVSVETEAPVRFT